MKKIIMAVAAVAMAASLFAVDVSAKIKWARNSLFDMEFKDGAKPNALQLAQPVGYYDHSAFGFKVAMSTEDVGASFEIAPGYNPGSINFDRLTTWLKPFDMLKITLGGNDFGYGAETIDWSKINDISGEGFGFSITPVAGLGIDLFAFPGLSSPWWTEKAWIMAGEIKAPCGIKLGYSADFGSINAHYRYNGNDTSDIGIGYSGNFSGVGVNVNGKFDLGKDGLTGITADLFVSMGFDALGVKAYGKFGTDMKDANDLKAKLWVTYGMDFGTIYLSVNNTSNGVGGDGSGNLLGKDFYLVAQPGVQFNIGVANCDVGLSFVMNKPENGDFGVAMHVPFAVTVGF